jgi:multidrug efflux pump subunit AcrB
MSLLRQDNPSVVAPAAVVQCIYPGATPLDVEKSILKPLEEELASLSGLKSLESFAVPNAGSIIVRLKDMSDADIELQYNEIRECVNRAESKLPAEAEKPTIDSDLATSYSLILGLTSQEQNPARLRDTAEEIEQHFSRLSGVTAVELFGAGAEEVLVSLDMVKLQQYGLAPLSIATALQASNISIPGGSLELSGRNVPVRLAGEFTSLADIENTVVTLSPDTGLPVHLSDICTIERREAEPSIQAMIGQTQGIMIGVKYAEDSNIITTGRQLRRECEKLTASLSQKGMELTVLNDQAVFTQEAINLFLTNFLFAVILVVVVVTLVMGLRSALIVSVPIALVVAAVLVAMLALGIPLHQVSIASLVISLSLLVANGVVSNDSIYLQLEAGMERDEACVTGTKLVSMPLLASTLTTVASFIPLALMKGVAGKFAYSLPLLVSVALSVSFITALTVVPAAGNRFLQLKGPSRFTKWAAYKARANDFYGKILARALVHPVRTLLIFVGLLLLSLPAVPGLGVQMFPPLERDQYTLEITLPNAYTLEATAQTAGAIANLLAEEPSVSSYAYIVGSGFPKYYMTFLPAAQSTGKANFLVNGDRAAAEDVAERLSLAIPDAVVREHSLEFNMPQTYPVQIRISGTDIDTLLTLANLTEDKVSEVKGVRRTELDYGQKTSELLLRLQREKAALVGLSEYDVARTVRMVVNGLEVAELKQTDLNKEALPVILQMTEADRGSREALDRIFVTSQITGEHVPLRQVTEITTETSLGRIVRRDRERTVTVGVIPQDNQGIETLIFGLKSALVDLELPEGYTLSYGGENEFTRETIGSMILPAVLAVLLIYLILALQIQKLVEPLIIMGTIPLAFIGIIWGLRLLGYPIGFMALIGTISLMGVVVNNGIILLDYIRVRRELGEEVRLAVVNACSVRLRPIIIGMVTTVISLLPMMLAGGSLWAPLATTVIAGMLISTLSTMLAIPCLYYLLNRRTTSQKH